MSSNKSDTDSKDTSRATLSEDEKVREARAKILSGLEPIAPGLYLSIAPSTIPSSYVGSDRARRRKAATRHAPIMQRAPAPVRSGQVRPPQARVTPRRS
jgi:hypothetical protein